MTLQCRCLSGSLLLSLYQCFCPGGNILRILSRCYHTITEQKTHRLVYKLQFCKDVAGLQQMKRAANENCCCASTYLKTNARPNMHKASGFIPVAYGSSTPLTRSHPHSSTSQGQGQSAQCGGNCMFLCLF